MSDGYAANGNQNIAASPGATVAGLTASTLVRGRMLELWAACEDTVADNMIRWLARRYTVAGTSTPVTPEEDDPGGPPAQLAVGSNHTVEPTYATVPLLDVPVHMRNTLHWMARDDRKGWLVPHTAANGIGVTPIHGTVTNAVRATIAWEE